MPLKRPDPKGSELLQLRAITRLRDQASFAASWHSWYMTDPDVEPVPTITTMPTGAGQDRQAWVRANFLQIFGTSPESLQAQGIDPRQYARQHRDQIRTFAQAQRSQGVAVPSVRSGGTNGPGNNGPSGPGSSRRGYGYGGGGRFGIGRRGGSAWIGIVLALFALRFLLVGSIVGAHAAIFWVLGIGGIMLAARVLLFSWLRNRRRNQR